MNAMNKPTRDTPLLFTPIKLRSVVVRNRIMAAPMCQYVSDDGGPTEWQMVNFGRFAMGGSGIVFGEETAVEASGRKTHHCAGLYKDEHIAQYRRINDFIKSLGATPAIQLGHCGRRASAHGPLQDRAPLTEADAKVGLTPWQGIAPSPIPASPGGALPREMDHDDIRQNLQVWREATQRSIDAGFDICEIHGAHGYLIHQFLSPVSNQRTDGYGGSVENRARFLLEVTEAVVGAWQPGRVGVRLSPTGAFGDMSDSDPASTFSHAARELNRFGLSFLHIMEALPGHPMASPGPRVSPLLRHAFQGPLILNGGYDAALGDQAIADGEADLIAYGVPFLANPDLVERFRIGAPLNPPDYSTLYSGGAQGYTDYPALTATP